MRVIKFRAWVPEVSAGEITLPGDMEYNPSWQDIQAIRTKTNAIPDGFGFEHVSDQISSLNKICENYGHALMQYTGLKDKNGKEIYEGDVVQHLVKSRMYPDGQIRHNTIEWTDDLEMDNSWGSHSSGFYMPIGADWEIIGNIYENPELIK